MTDRTVIVGVESSCDETACAVVADGREVLVSVVASQIELHKRFGGVVPEIASRAHVEAVNTVIGEAMEQSGVNGAGISAVAVTCEPGLIGSLLVGLMAGKTLAWARGVPLIGVNHIYGHAYSPTLNAEPIDYPAVALVASGGHTALYRCDSPTEMKLLGLTIDDAAGEAYDKVASILKLGYPGGPAIDRKATQGDPKAVRFPRSLLKDRSLDFSFSGIKTAVLYYVNGNPGAVRETAKGFRGAETMTDQQIADTAASFQAAVVDVLTRKLRWAARDVGARTLVLGGGVAANSELRASAGALASELGATLRLPELRFCGDNAAMIAGLAHHYLQQGKTDGWDLPARPTVRR